MLKLILLIFGQTEGQEVCRVLSMSGGGAKGAYEVGAIHELYNL